jgi:hypothetical protein
MISYFYHLVTILNVIFVTEFFLCIVIIVFFYLSVVMSGFCYFLFHIINDYYLHVSK